MRGRHLRFWLLSGLLVAINVAGLLWIRHEVRRTPAQALRVLEALPERDVDEADRLVLRFDEPLARPEQIGAPLDRAPFRVEPRPPGVWVFAAADRLEYRLDEPLPPGRVFQVRPAEDVEEVTGRRVVGPSTFTFATRPLRVYGCELLAADRRDATIEVRFNQPVDPGRVLDAVDVRPIARPGRVRAVLADEPIPVALLTADPGERVVLRVARGDRRALRVRLDPALCGLGGERPLGRESVHRVDLPVAFAVLGVSVPTPSLERRLTVTIRFSAPLDRGQVLPPIEIVPALDGVHASVTRRGIALTGAFEPGRRYVARVPETVLASGGEPLGASREVSIEIPPRRPALRFAHARGILSPRGNLELELHAINVPEVLLRATRVHANNLVPAMRGERASKTSRHVAESRVRLDADAITPEDVLVDLGALLDEPLGVYEVEARAADGSWTSSDAVVCVTDLAITAKQQRDGLFAWVTSVRTGAPVAGAAVTALGYTNQVLAQGVTGTDGTTTLPLSSSHPDGPAWLLAARLGDDVTVLLPGRRPWVIDGADVAGRTPPEAYDVLLFADRGVYRPGEVVRVTGIVRDAGGAIPAPFPLSIEVARPDGTVVLERIVTWESGGQGIVEADVPTDAEGQTGPYRIGATLPGAKTRLGETYVHVEAFVPLRHEIDASATAARYAGDEVPAVTIAARSLWGRPASGATARLTGRLEPARFHSAARPDHVFGPLALPARVAVGEHSVVLDEEGRADVELEGLDPAGLCRAELTATVTEPGSRSVSRGVAFTLDPRGRHLGLRAPGRPIVRSGVATTLGWALVDGDDASIEPGGPLRLVLERIDHDWILERVDGERRFRSVARTAVVDEREVDGAGDRAFDVEPPGPGRYRVTLTASCGAVAQLELWANEGGVGDGSLVADQERLELVLDAPRYSAGATASVLVRAPFPGTLLLTLEGREVLCHEVAELTGRALEIPLRVPDELRGGAFVTATLVRPVDPADPDWRPHRALGMTRLVADHADHALPLAIGAPSEALPGDRVTIEIRGVTPVDPARPTQVRLWAVDEGILATTGYHAPDPATHFLAPWRATIVSADAFGELLPDHVRAAGTTRIGGDADLLARRRSPVPTQRGAPAVVWHGLVALDSEGRARVDLPMPALHGAMRVMAVGVDHDRYGAAERSVVLSAPLLAEASGPRAVAPGDAFRVPVRIDNTTDEALTATVDVEFAGSLALAAPNAPAGTPAITPGMEVPVAPGATERLWIEVRAGQPGPATFTARVTATSPSRGTLLAESRVPIAVRHAGPLHRHVELVRSEAGTITEVPWADDLLPGSATTSIVISPLPDVELRPALEQLVDYPYGCVEQTTSRLYASLCLGTLLGDTASSAPETGVVARLVAAGIARLWSMQTSSGGLAYWPGGSEPTTWGTSYAALLLARAMEDGHVVDERLVDGIVGYLEGVLVRRGRSAPDDDMRAMLCRVLASFGREQPGWMSTLTERVDTLDTASRAHLSQAWLHAGRRDRALEVLALDGLPQRVATTTGGRLTSAVRQDGLLLEALLDVAPEHPLVGSLAGRLESTRTAGRWGSTLSSASAMVALTRYQDRRAAATRAEYAGTLRCGERSWTFDHAAPLAVELERGESGPIVIESTGRGELYVVVESVGRANTPVTPYDRGLEVRRRWVDDAGAPIDPASLAVGDLVQVEIEVRLTPEAGTTRVRNVAVVDALPGGLEVEHPRLQGSAGAGRTSTSAADRVEFLDDRVVIFCTTRLEPSIFRYALRVVTAGEFAQPPAQASCMYDEALASLHGGGAVQVRP